MNWAELSYELGRVVLVRDFIRPSGLVRVVFGRSCPAPFFIAPAYSKVRYRGSTFRPFVRSSVRPSTIYVKVLTL